MTKNKPTKFAQKPSNYTDELFVYTSRIIFERCDIDREYKRLKDAEKLPHNTSINTFKLNMALIINFLSHNLSENSITNVSRIKLIKASNTKMYRLCIDVLKRHKILFICSRNGVESYKVDEFSKGYKFNITLTALEHDTPVKIKVNDHRVIKKVITNVDQLQISKHLMEHFKKSDMIINPHKSKSWIKAAKTMLECFKNSNFIRECLHVRVFKHVATLKKDINVKKNYMRYLLHQKTAYRLNNRYFNDLTTSQIGKLTGKLKDEWANMGMKSAHIVTKQINNLFGKPNLIDYDPHFTRT